MYLIFGISLQPNDQLITCGLVAAVSPHKGESGIREIFYVESGILRFEIQNLKESGSHFLFEFGIQVRLTRNPESSTWSPESRIVLDSLTSGEQSNFALLCIVTVAYGKYSIS